MLIKVSYFRFISLNGYQFIINVSEIILFSSIIVITVVWVRIVIFMSGSVMLFVVSGVHCELTADIRIFLSLLLCFLVLFMAILVSMSRLATLATHC